MPARAHILAVDDEPFNLDILEQYLGDAGYRVTAAHSGRAALDLLATVENVDVVVLDRMMPSPNGMEVLAAIKANELWRHIPVVMQTAAGTKEQIAEGMRAGAYYYLVKPYEEAMLLAMIKAATSEAKQRRLLRDELKAMHKGFGLASQMTFQFRTLSDARELSEFLARCFPHAPGLEMGLTELTVNAIEHGNLGITYQEKSALVVSNRWEAEVARRLDLPENADKFAELRVSATRSSLTFHLIDRGSGFDWRAYQDFSAERAADPHGRGIAMARSLAFQALEFLGRGNEVRCTVALSPTSIPAKIG